MHIADKVAMPHEQQKRVPAVVTPLEKLLEVYAPRVYGYREGRGYEVRVQRAEWLVNPHENPVGFSALPNSLTANLSDGTWSSQHNSSS